MWAFEIFAVVALASHARDESIRVSTARATKNNLLTFMIHFSPYKVILVVYRTLYFTRSARPESAEK
jgi:hypothetical protein